MLKSLILSISLLLTVALPGTAMAHPSLVTATPSPDATVNEAKSISLTFSEDLVAPLSGIKLTMTAMPGMANHKPMPVKGFETEIKGKTLVAKLPRALPAGDYVLEWHVVAADQHRIEGSYTFKVD